MSRLDGKFIKLGTITEDRLHPDVPLGGDIPPGTVTAEMLAAALLDKLLVVTWGEVEVVDPTTRKVTLQLADLAGNPVEAAHALRVWMSTIFREINSGLGRDLVAARQTRESRVFV